MTTTRLGQIGVGVDSYAGFESKSALDSPEEQITRLTLVGIGGAKYAGFLVKAPAEAVPEPEIPSAGLFGAAFPLPPHVPRHYRLRVGTGVFRVRGSPVRLTLSLRLSVEAGEFTFSGGSIAAHQNYTLSVQPGSFNVTGADARLVAVLFNATDYDNDFLLMAA